jgi:hypothetical protein
LRPVATWTPPPEVLHRIAFELPCREPGEWEPALDELLRRACADLDHQWAQALEINVETPAGTLAARRVLKEPVNRPDSLHRPARSALAEALGIVPLQPVVVALEVRLGALTGADTQRNLFEGLEKSTDARHSDRRKRLGRVIERMETRCPGTLGQYAAGNSHSPFREDAFRWLPALRELHRLRAAP